MRIGIICEGHSDRGVIVNILKGFTKIESYNIIPLRPTDLLDETDKHIMTNLQFSTWSLVKKECEEKELINDFLLTGDFVVIHLDTAECDQYSVARPEKKTHKYCDELRTLVVKKISEWIGNKEISDKVLHAISIEEIEAWLLAIYDPKNSCSSATPKEKLSRVLGRLKINSTPSYSNYFVLSEPFAKQKSIKRGKFLAYNCSLNFFCEEIKTKTLSLLINE